MWARPVRFDLQICIGLCKYMCVHIASVRANGYEAGKDTITFVVLVVSLLCADICLMSCCLWLLQLLTHVMHVSSLQTHIGRAMGRLFCRAVVQTR